MDRDQQMAIRQKKIDSFQDDLINARVDASVVDDSIMDDPVKLLEWLASNGEASPSPQVTQRQDAPRKKRVVSSVLGGPKQSTASSRRINRDEGRDKIAVHSKLSGNVTISVDEIVFARAYWNETSIDTFDNWYICSMQFVKFSKYLSDGSFTFLNDGRGFIGAARTSEVTRVTERADGVFEVYLDIADATIESIGKPRDWYLDTFGESKVELLANADRDAQGHVEGETDTAEEPAREEVQITSPELVGLLIGIACDGRVNICEAKMLKRWLEQLDDDGDSQVQEIKDLLEKVLDDDIVTEEEEQEMLRLFNRITGIVADDVYTEEATADSAVESCAADGGIACNDETPSESASAVQEGAGVAERVSTVRSFDGSVVRVDVIGLNKLYTDEGVLLLEDAECVFEEDEEHPDGRIVSVFLSGSLVGQTTFAGEIRYQLLRAADDSLLIADVFTVPSLASGEKLERHWVKSFGLHEGSYILKLLCDDLREDPGHDQTSSWIEQGLCPECGGELIRHYFGSRCVRCGARLNANPM